MLLTDQKQRFLVKSVNFDNMTVIIVMKIVTVNINNFVKI